MHICIHNHIFYIIIKLYSSVLFTPIVVGVWPPKATADVELPAVAKDSLINLEVGEYYGPYKDGEYYKLSKMIAIEKLPEGYTLENLWDILNWIVKVYFRI